MFPRDSQLGVAPIADLAAVDPKQQSHRFNAAHIVDELFFHAANKHGGELLSITQLYRFVHFCY
jgi:hypothetical protein